MANIVITPFSSITILERTIRPGNALATEDVIGPLPEESGPGGGSGSGDPTPTPTIPTEGIIWWPRR